MASIQLITAIIALYIYIPIVLFRYGISRKYRLSKISKDDLEASHIYFITRSSVPIILNIAIPLFLPITKYQYRIDIIILSLFNDKHDDVFKILTKTNYGLLISHLLLMYFTTYFSSYLFRVWKKFAIKPNEFICQKIGKKIMNFIFSLLEPPFESLKAIEKYILLYKRTPDSIVPVDILTDSNILYSGDLVEILHNKEDQPSIVIIENPTKCYLFKKEDKAEFLNDDEIKSNKKTFESDKLMINFSKVININFTKEKDKILEITSHNISKEKKSVFEDIEKEMNKVK